MKDSSQDASSERTSATADRHQKKNPNPQGLDVEFSETGQESPDGSNIPAGAPRIKTQEQAEKLLQGLREKFAKPGSASTPRQFLASVRDCPTLNKQQLRDEHRILANALIPFFPTAQERNAEARKEMKEPGKAKAAKPRKDAFTLSPSRLRLLQDCPRCFWLQQHGIWQRPESSFPSLPNGMDRILKNHFDEFARKGALPPALACREECKGMKLYEPKGRLRNMSGGFGKIKVEDSLGNILEGIPDYLLKKDDKLVVLDFKTRGVPVKPETPARSQCQLDTYNFILRENDFTTEDFAFLLFYIPESVGMDGKVSFDTNLIRMNVNVSSAKRTWQNALAILSGPCPDTGCEWCKGFDFEYRTRTKADHERQTTCGILLYDLDPLRVFLVRESGVYQKHFTGEPGNWGIPKGGLKKDKTHFETALCEFEEETGISLDPNAPYEDLGPQPYNRHKDIHAWALRWLPRAGTKFVCSTGRKRLNPKTQQNKFIGEVIDWKIFTGEEALKVINHRQLFLLKRLIAPGSP